MTGCALWAVGAVGFLSAVAGVGSAFGVLFAGLIVVKRRGRA